jgi:hypothetical protein
MANHLALKIVATGIILICGVTPTAVVLFQDKVANILSYVPISNRCLQAVPDICEMRCRSKDNCALEWVKK